MTTVALEKPWPVIFDQRGSQSVKLKKFNAVESFRATLSKTFFVGRKCNSENDGDAHQRKWSAKLFWSLPPSYAAVCQIGSRQLVTSKASLADFLNLFNKTSYGYSLVFFSFYIVYRVQFNMLGVDRRQENDEESSYELASCLTLFRIYDHFCVWIIGNCLLS